MYSLFYNRLFCSGTLFGANLYDNIIDQNEGKFCFPMDEYLVLARKAGWTIIDICSSAKRWKLKQCHTGTTEELQLLNSLILYIWDYFLSLSGCHKIMFVTTGLLSYAVCNMIDKRGVESKVRGISVISPTQFLPIVSQEKAEWYQRHSQVMLPSRKPAGTPIMAAPIFGSCASSGSNDPIEIYKVISRSQDRVFRFLLDCIGHQS